MLKELKIVLLIEALILSSVAPYLLDHMALHVPLKEANGSLAYKKKHVNTYNHSSLWFYCGSIRYINSTSSVIHRLSTQLVMGDCNNLYRLPAVDCTNIVLLCIPSSKITMNQLYEKKMVSMNKYPDFGFELNHTTVVSLLALLGLYL